MNPIVNIDNLLHSISFKVKYVMSLTREYICRKQIIKLNKLNSIDL